MKCTTLIYQRTCNWEIWCPIAQGGKKDKSCEIYIRKEVHISSFLFTNPLRLSPIEKRSLIHRRRLPPEDQTDISMQRHYVAPLSASPASPSTFPYCKYCTVDRCHALLAPHIQKCLQSASKANTENQVSSPAVFLSFMMNHDQISSSSNITMNMIRYHHHHPTSPWTCIWVKPAE